ncbi:MAG TPA: hopanoid-associated sugar epimerase [Beijerinckiaceae bacterium]|jgi:dihydroflavonol-4-reductase|nr:hopanoid-associated sugar epimerase [Beijerinckiaceae bacterium]
MKSEPEVFITGASGFVGSAVLRALIESGLSVRALVRRNSPRGELTELGAQCAEGDLRDRASVGKAIAGCRYVFHVAADYRLWSRDDGEIFATNVTGTRNVMDGAKRAGVERIVYTSSVATLALRPDGAPADESVSLSEREAIGAYKRSKIAAEQLVREMIAEQSLPAVIVNPSTPIGPRDVRPTPTGRIIIAAASGRIPAFIDTGLNLVHVDDVARGHLAALREGQIGERYILGGQNVRFAQMLCDIAALVGRRPPRLCLPWYATLPIACAAEATAWVTGREPLATLDGVRMAKYRMFFDTSKAERQLGVSARPYVEGLRDAIRWFSESGSLVALPKKSA